MLIYTCGRLYKTSEINFIMNRDMYMFSFSNPCYVSLEKNIKRG